MANYEPDKPLPRDHKNLIEIVEMYYKDGHEWAVYSKNKDLIPSEKRKQIERSALLNIKASEHPDIFKTGQTKKYIQDTLQVSSIYFFFTKKVAERFDSKQDILFHAACGIYGYFHYNHHYHQIAVSPDIIEGHLSIWKNRKSLLAVVENLYTHPIKIGTELLIWERIVTRRRLVAASRWTGRKIREFSVIYVIYSCVRKSYIKICSF